jgi:hypothetical protein
VIGVVGFAALCGAGFFFWRSKQNKTNAAFGGGTTGGYGRDSNPPSMSDSRFDGDYMAQRRQSNGSIDDDHDFSRRILQVNIPVNASPSSNAYYNSGDEPRSLNRLSYRFTHPSTLLPLSSVFPGFLTGVVISERHQARLLVSIVRDLLFFPALPWNALNKQASTLPCNPTRFLILNTGSPSPGRPDS